MKFKKSIFAVGGVAVVAMVAAVTVVGFTQTEPSFSCTNPTATTIVKTQIVTYLKNVMFMSKLTESDNPLLAAEFVLSSNGNIMSDLQNFADTYKKVSADGQPYAMEFRKAMADTIAEGEPDVNISDWREVKGTKHNVDVLPCSAVLVGNDDKTAITYNYVVTKNAAGDVYVSSNPHKEIYTNN